MSERDSTDDQQDIETSAPEGMKIVDVVTLRFDGENQNGSRLHELKTEHVADVLEGLTELSGDFEKAGVFHAEGIEDSELFVRPAKEGSFFLEVIRVVQENPDVAKDIAAWAGVGGVPSLSTVIWWSTKSMRAEVEDFSHLENGNVKVQWSDKTSQEIPVAAWNELQKRTRRRKKQLRKIMAPLGDGRVKDVEVSAPSSSVQDESYELTKADYAAVKPEDDIFEETEFFEVEASMSAIDFDDPDRWRIRTKKEKRTASVEDEWFLNQIENGLPIGRDDLFQLKVREDRITKNGRTTRKWTVLHVDWEEESDAEEGKEPNLEPRASKD